MEVDLLQKIIYPLSSSLCMTLFVLFDGGDGGCVSVYFCLKRDIFIDELFDFAAHTEGKAHCDSCWREASHS